MSLPRKVTVLGSTGSIGLSTLDLLEHVRDAGQGVEIDALVGGRNAEKLAEQALAWRPKAVVIAAVLRPEPAGSWPLPSRGRTG